MQSVLLLAALWVVGSTSIPHACSGHSSRLLLAALQEQLLMGNYGDDAIRFPVFHRHVDNGEYVKLRDQPSRSTLVDLSPAAPSPASPTNGSTPSPPAQPSDLKSTLVTLNEPFGQYFAVFEIGTPPVDIAVIIDTGSELLWIQCQPCVECGVQAQGYEIFTPNKSSTFNLLQCTSDANCPSTDSVATSCDTNDLCFYHVTYGDNSNSSGYLSKDTLTVGTASKAATPYQYKDLVFGCGVVNEGVEAQLNSSGLMGLDRGAFSIISQLQVGVFAYCLPNRIQTTDVSGYLTIGKSSLTSSASLKYTPMLQNNASSFRLQFYYMNMTGISVNGKLLDIPSSAFQISDTADAGGTIIDSGTTLTSFVDEAYSVFADAFAQGVDSSLTKADSGDLNLLCYQLPLSQTQAPQAPKVTLHFDNNLDLDLDTDHSFRLYGHDTTYNYYCMAYNNAGSLSDGARNFIGNYQQQDFLVEYDIANSRIGFAPTVCNQGSSNGDSIYTNSWLTHRFWPWAIPMLAIILIL